MTDPFKEAVEDYYSKKTEYSRLLSAAAHGDLKDEPPPADWKRPSWPGAKPNSLPKQQENLQAGQDSPAPAMESLDQAHDLLKHLSIVDGAKTNFEDIAKALNARRRQDERATDKASAETRKKWAEIDRLLGFKPTKW